MKTLSKMWDLELKNGAPAKKYGHRALEDIKESIEELAYYKEHLWKVPKLEELIANKDTENKVERKGDS